LAPRDEEQDVSERAALERARALVLPELIGWGRRAHPHRPALIFGTEQRTHAALDDRAARLASVLAGHGVRAGDRVALLLHNGFEFVESMLACHKLAACAVPVNFRLTLEEIRFIVEDAGAVGLIAGEQLDELGASLAKDVAAIRVYLGVGTAPAGALVYNDVVSAASPQLEPAPLREDDLALTCYTSGTTGRPKGAMLSHRSLVASTLSWIHEMGAGENDMWLSGQPLFHIGGINGLLPFLVLGATCVITPTTGFDPERALALLQAHEVTMCIFVPTQWDAVCASPRVREIDVRRLRVAMWSASPASLATLARIGETFPEADIVSAYGQTEMGGATTLLKGPDATRKMGSIGKPMLGIDLRLVDEQLRDVPVEAVGEVVYRGPTVMSGYWGNTPATDDSFAGGWFHSGDLAIRDDEGCLRLVDRKKDLIISGGENIYPAEVERALLEHPAVAEAAVVGVPHPRWVETPLAFIVAAAGEPPTEEELIAHVRVRLASYKKPSAVIVVDSLPRNGAGKVLKRQLRDAHRDRFAEAANDQQEVDVTR
jgi:acyl-CoA synthetase (AMP-forming)/AMP-acid ligase II